MSSVTGQDVRKCRGQGGLVTGGQEMSCPAIDNYPLFPPNCCWLLLIFNIKLPPDNYLITDYGAASAAATPGIVKVGYQRVSSDIWKLCPLVRSPPNMG